MAFKFLTDNDTSFKAIWFWARQLVTDLNKMSASSELEAGHVSMWPTNTLPTGWLLCDGSDVSATAYPALFNAIGYQYGGSGDTFKLPPFTNRAPMGAGATVALGGTAGAETVALTTANLPTHTHTLDDPGHDHTFTPAAHSHTITDPGHTHTGGYVGAASVTAGGAGAGAGSTGSAVTGIAIDPATADGTVDQAATGILIAEIGGSEAFSLINPVVGINFIIKA